MIENLEGEIWVPIYRNYEISNMGRIISNKRKVPILMKSYKQNRDYDLVHFRFNGKRLAKTIHRLVGLIFVKNIDPSKTTINHERGKDDNRAESLTWMTQSENTNHGFENGLISRGSKRPLAVLDDIQVLTIRSLRGELTQEKLANYFKVTRGVIGTIMTGKTWKHLIPKA